LSHSFETLILFRVIQGFCGGIVIPAVFTAGFLLFPEGRRILPTAVAGVFAVLAPTLGPVVGGYITETYSWHWLFLINLAPGLVVSLLVGPVLRVGPPDWTLLRSFDFVSLALLAVCLASLEILLKEAPPRGWGN